MSERYRCFFAVDPCDDVRRAVTSARGTVAAAAGDVRWTRPESLHVTLEFLGDVQSERIDAIAAAASVAFDGGAPFVMRARGIGAFPTLRRPRVLWIGIEAPPLKTLAAALDAALVRCGFPASGPWRPHLTIGRVRSLRGSAETRGRLEALGERDFGTTWVESVQLYRSHLQPGGSVYEELARFPLAGGGDKEGVADGHRQ